MTKSLIEKLEDIITPDGLRPSQKVIVNIIREKTIEIVKGHVCEWTWAFYYEDFLGEEKIQYLTACDQRRLTKCGDYCSMCGGMIVIVEDKDK